MKALRSILGLVTLVVVALPPSSLGQSCPQPLDASQTAEVYRIAPHTAPAIIQQHLEIVQRCIQVQTAAVDLAIKHYEYAMQFLPSATDEPTYQTWRTFAATVMSPTYMRLIPVNYSAEWVTHVLANRTLRTK